MTDPELRRRIRAEPSVCGNRFSTSTAWRSGPSIPVNVTAKNVVAQGGLGAGGREVSRGEACPESLRGLVRVPGKGLKDLSLRPSGQICSCRIRILLPVRLFSRSS